LVRLAHHVILLPSGHTLLGVVLLLVRRVELLLLVLVNGEINRNIDIIGRTLISHVVVVNVRAARENQRYITYFPHSHAQALVTLSNDWQFFPSSFFVTAITY